MAWWISLRPNDVFQDNNVREVTCTPASTKMQTMIYVFDNAVEPLKWVVFCKLSCDLEVYYSLVL